MFEAHNVPASSAILVATDSGHALLDPIAALTDGISRRWELLLSASPPTQPYMPAVTEPPKKKRKVASDTTPNELAGLEHHEAVKSWLSDAITELREVWLQSDAKSWLESTIQVKSKEAAGDSLAAWTDATAELLQQVSESDQLEALVLRQSWYGHLSRGLANNNDLSAEERLAMASLFHRPVHNNSTEVRLISTSTSSWLIPAQSGFLLADMKDWSNVLRGLHLPCDIKIALLDPPWPSASVRRSSLYQDMDIYDLFKIDLPAILSRLSETPVLVGVWVTNHAKYRRFVKDKLFRDWNISGAVDWYWVKITTNVQDQLLSQGGLPVFPVDGNSPRRCYEGLILGYYNPLKELVPELPNDRAFLSVPLEHSRKPLIIDLLRSYVTSGGRPGLGILELFARFVPSGRRGAKPSTEDTWLSVGNEAIRFNEIGRSWQLCLDETDEHRPEPALDASVIRKGEGSTHPRARLNPA